MLFLCSLLFNCKNKDRNASGDTGKNEDTTAIAEKPEKDTMKTVDQMDTNEIEQTNITNDTILTIEDRIKAETRQVTEALKTNADAYKIVTEENYTITWDTIDTGMYYANMLPPVRSKIGESYLM